MLSIIGFVLAIAILVFVHEFGHYYIAKSFGVKIEQFSIGFGKELYSRVDGDGVRWKICAIPLGGFVKMYGDTDPLSVNNIEVEDKTKAFYSKPLHARFLIVAAGPIANYLLAVIILASFYFTFGKVEVPAVIGEVIQNSPAQLAGIREMDKIIAVNGKKINNFSDLQRLIMMSHNQQLNLVADRAGNLIELSLIAAEKILADSKPVIKVGYIGIIAENKPVHLKMNVFASCYQGVLDVIDISSLALKTVQQIFTGKRSAGEIYGSFTIAQKSGEALAEGPLEFALFIAMLSINLGLINLLPIPILDGGHLMFIIYEAIAQKPLTRYAQNILLKIGGVIIIFLIVISTSNDIRGLIF